MSEAPLGFSSTALPVHITMTEAQAEQWSGLLDRLQPADHALLLGYFEALADGCTRAGAMAGFDAGRAAGEIETLRAEQRKPQTIRISSANPVRVVDPT